MGLGPEGIWRSGWDLLVYDDGGSCDHPTPWSKAHKFRLSKMGAQLIKHSHLFAWVQTQGPVTISVGHACGVHLGGPSGGPHYEVLLSVHQKKVCRNA